MCDRIVRFDAQALMHMIELCAAILSRFVVLWIILISLSPMSSALHRIRLQLQDIQLSSYIAYVSSLCKHYANACRIYTYTVFICLILAYGLFVQSRRHFVHSTIVNLLLKGAKYSTLRFSFACVFVSSYLNA